MGRPEFKADPRRPIGTLVAVFSEEGVVVDEGQTYRCMA